MAIIVDFFDGNKRIEDMNDPFGFAGAREVDGEFYALGQILDLLLNLGKADNKLSSNKGGSISPLDIVHVKIEKF
jgi:hypothetical protein